jgi:hypothetical protein
MPQSVVIPNPIINTLFEEPRRHFFFSDEGITNRITGQTRRDKEAKTGTAEKLWVPAVNNAAQWGRWGFVEITDPWDATGAIREKIQKTARNDGAPRPIGLGGPG